MYKFSLFQDGVMVVGVEAKNIEAALKEIQHYALIYLQDGPVVIKAEGEDNGCTN